MRRMITAGALATCVALANGCTNDQSYLLDAAPTFDALDVVVAHETGSADVPTAVDDRASADARDVSDATADAPDASPADVVESADHADAATDTADASDAAVDAGPSGRCTPAVDGRIGDDWTADAVVATNAATSIWAGNSLDEIRVCYDAGSLYLGVAGTVQAGNALVVYLDRDFGTASGISDFTALTDNTGTLDDAVSGVFTLTDDVVGFAADGAWGSVGMNSATAPNSLTEPRAGLRAFLPTPGNFAWVAGVATACDAANRACEVAIPWTALFGTMPAPSHGTVAMFARVVNGLGTESPNLTLPADDGARPRTVSHVLLVPFVR